MKKYLILLFSVIVLCPMNVKGLMCANSKKVEYQEMAKNIAVNYEYVESDNDVTFSIKISNIPNMFIVYDAVNQKTYNYSSSELIINNVNKNTSYRFDIYKHDDACSWINFYSHYVNVPPYNYYYKDEVCSDIKDYKLCSKWLNVTVSYDEWKNKVLEYKNSLNKDNEEEKEEKVQGLFDIIIAFYANYYMFILPGIILLSLGGIYLYNKKHDLF